MALSDAAILRDLLRPLQDLEDAAAICKYLESFYTLRKVCQTLQSSQVKNTRVSVSQNGNGVWIPIITGLETITFFAAIGFYHKHIGRGLVQGLLCIT